MLPTFFLWFCETEIDKHTMVTEDVDNPDLALSVVFPGGEHCGESVLLLLHCCRLLGPPLHGGGLQPGQKYFKSLES